MTAQEYITAGYPVSVVMTQAQIDRAEADIKDAYIKPILPTATYAANTADRKALMELSFILLLQRSVKATRSGAKIKTSLQSQNASEDEVLYQTKMAHVLLEEVRKQTGAVKDAKVHDICSIYFSTNYFGGE